MKAQEIYRCGVCDCYHRNDWHGDCREDAERMDFEDVLERFGEEGDGWREVEMCAEAG